jgi:hypothetical protein
VEVVGVDSVRVRLAAVIAVLVLGAAVALWWATGPRGGGSNDRGRTRAEIAAARERGGGVDDRDEDPARLRVLGRVVDDDGEPLEGGSLTLSCLRDDGVVATIEGGALAIGEDGAFAGPGCAGTICAELHHPSAIAAAPWTLDVGRAAILRAPSLPRLWGVVEDVTGEPIADARVRILAPADAGDDPAALPVVAPDTSTDVDGFWSLALLERPPCDPCREAQGACKDEALVVHDRVELQVRAAGHGAALVELDLTTPKGRVPEDPVRVRLGAPADPVAGTLRDPEGRAYPRAQVLARSTERRLEQHTAIPRTEDGAFAFAELGDGGYEVRALQDGTELVTWTPVEPGDRIALVGDRRANGPDVLVEITHEGRPASDVRVDGGPFHDARTDMEGQVRAQRVLPGTTRLLLRRGARRAISRSIDVPDRAGAEGDPQRYAIELSADATSKAARDR